MLFILCGPDNSGKKTFRNLLAEQYGFKIIEKYTTDQIDERSLFHYSGDQSGIKRHKGDPYLCVAPPDSKISKEIREEAERIKNYPNLQPTELGRILVYDRPKNRFNKGNESVLYGIVKSEIQSAAQDEKNYFLLVCSHGATVNTISRVVGHNFKGILLLGRNGPTSSRTPEEAVNKVLQYFLENMEHFPYVLYNRYDRNATLPEIQSRLSAQWETFDDVPKYKVCPHAGIFFVKPFSTHECNQFGGPEGTSIRPNFIFGEINAKILNLASTCGLKDVCALPVQNDSQRAQKMVVTNIEEQINRSNLIIADLADVWEEPIGANKYKCEHKPCCYWEIGYARAKNKSIIVIADIKSASNIPFNERGFDYIPYSIEAKNEISPQRKDEIVFLANPSNEDTFETEINKFLNEYRRIEKAALIHKKLIEESQAE